ncbi:ORF937 [White spot syndrome virus]|uniref:ORF937 n=1 Tax=White spot syndrome virus TaxID=342409 RepID=A0A2D3I6M6_9VIRU|nr:ORF937 [White spot syndrome virus]
MVIIIAHCWQSPGTIDEGTFSYSIFLEEVEEESSTDLDKSVMVISCKSASLVGTPRVLLRGPLFFEL